MKTPTTQEEKDYRESLTQRVSTISNMISLFSDIEDKGRRLDILKNLVSTLNYGTEITQAIEDEISAYEEAQAKELANAEAAKNGGPDEADGPDDMGANLMGGEEAPDLGNSSEAPIMETLFSKNDLDLLNESSGILTEEDTLPTPEELSKIDFTENK